MNEGSASMPFQACSGLLDADSWLFRSHKFFESEKEAARAYRDARPPKPAAQGHHFPVPR
jgi:hypothetical protein